MAQKLIGREKERKILETALKSNEAEMVAVIGRRRVGKTFLVKTVYKDHFTFQFTGIQNVSPKEQLQNFSYALGLARGEFDTPPKNWLEAFMKLILYLKENQNSQKQVVFIDELPWLSDRKSGFLNGLSFFWNSWAVDQPIVVVICGSAASWMIQKVVNHTGGLHNRITQYIHLQPFTLRETEIYLQDKNINLNRYHIVQLYMALGGIPHYLKNIQGGKSTMQIIDDLCFSKTGILKNEFSKLYLALFDNAERHITIVRALTKKWKGISRQELIKATNLTDGGTITKTLEELIQSGFITAYHPFGKKKKDKLYRLTDEYSLFYLQFIENNIQEGRQTWHHISQTQQYKIWSGYTFESLCIKHLLQIKKSLDIAGVYSTSSSFFKKGNNQSKGTQIDLLLDRNDGVINLFEMKFYNKNFTIDKAYAQSLKDKMDVFEETTKTQKLLFWTLVTTFGLNHNEHSLGLIDSVLTLDDLFVEVS